MCHDNDNLSIFTENDRNIINIALASMLTTIVHLLHSLLGNQMELAGVYAAGFSKTPNSYSQKSLQTLMEVQLKSTPYGQCFK